MNTHSIAAGNLGYPRIGLHRELKLALERFWAGEGSSQELEAATRELRAARWRIQAEAGIVHIPSNDFSLYDHVLDAAVLVGAIPARFGRHFEDLDLPTYFAMARGSKSAPAMEMTKSRHGSSICTQSAPPAASSINNCRYTPTSACAIFARSQDLPEEHRNLFGRIYEMLILPARSPRSEERRVGKECRTRW